MSISTKDNGAEVLAALEAATKRGLEAIGMSAEGHAKGILSETVYTGDKPYKLTGRLRNSITWAISGGNANISSYTGDNGEDGGTYTGTAPDDNNPAVYVGTNVEYAVGIETGSHRKAGGVHMLQRAATEYSGEYKRLMEESLENA